MQIISLNTLVKFLMKNTGVRICLHDISGILENEDLFVEYKYKIHSSDFCMAAKTTQRGLELCLTCKIKANQKAAYNGEHFCGSCAYGLLELAYPLTMDFKTKCIIYVGNVVKDVETSQKKLKCACRLTGVDCKKMNKLFDDCKIIKNEDILLEIAQIIESYIILTLKNSEKDTRKGGVSWAVNNVQEYINSEYSDNITLHNCAELYFVNEKYLGRMFEKNVGMTFHQYLNHVRCENARKMLKDSSKTITDIAFECGYSDVTYFNRVFKKIYGFAPGQARKKTDSQKR